MQIDRFTNEIKFKQLIGILRNLRPNYRAALCGFNIHSVIYDAARAYSPIDWHQLILELPHAAKDGTSIAYYSKDINVGKTATVTKIGKYIKRHFPMIPDNILRDMVTPYIIKAEFIDDMDEIIKIMESDNVPSSCMTGKQFTVHPYRVYNPAYGWKLCIKRQGNNIIGRALVNDMNYVRAYTSSSSSNSGTSIDCELETWLDSQGYELRTSWPVGTKVAKIQLNNSDNIIAPYIDGNNDNLDDHGHYLTISNDGDFEASNTSGFAEHKNTCTCEECGDRMADDDSTYVDNYGSVCPSCIDRHFVYIESYRDGNRYRGDFYIHTRNAIETIEGEYYPDDSFTDYDIVELHDGKYTNIDNVIRCESTDEYYHTDDIGELIAPCEDVNDEYRSDFWQCAVTDLYYSDDECYAYNSKGEKIHPDEVTDLELVIESDIK